MRACDSSLKQFKAHRELTGKSSRGPNSPEGIPVLGLGQQGIAEQGKAHAGLGRCRALQEQGLAIAGLVKGRARQTQGTARARLGKGRARQTQGTARAGLGNRRAWQRQGTAREGLDKRRDRQRQGQAKAGHCKSLARQRLGTAKAGLGNVLLITTARKKTSMQLICPAFRSCKVKHVEIQFQKIYSSTEEGHLQSASKPSPRSPWLPPEHVRPEDIFASSEERPTIERFC